MKIFVLIIQPINDLDELSIHFFTSETLEKLLEN